MPTTTHDLSVLRADFPALARRRNGMPPIYLNNACSTLRPRPVIDAIVRSYELFPTCGGGRAIPGTKLHNWFQEELGEEEAGAREAVAKLVGASCPEEIVWTRNTTEAINLVARSFPFAPGDEVLGGENEHNSNLVPWLELERRLRAGSGRPDLVVRRWFPYDEDGVFDVGRALAAVTPRTRIVSIAHTSNLDGAAVPDADVRALADRVHAVGGVLLLDAAQSVPHRPIDVKALGADFLAFSFHKMCGPTGIGVLWGRRERLAALEPFLVGGDTVEDTWLDRAELKPPPERYEAGVQHYAGMIGAAAAVRYVTETAGLLAIEEHERALAERTRARLAPLENDHFWLRGPKDASRRTGVVTMASSVGAIVNAIERLADEESNVMLRKGMFCTNAFLHHRYDRAANAKNNLRASFYLYNTEAECDVLCDVVERVVRDPLAFLDDE